MMPATIIRMTPENGSSNALSGELFFHGGHSKEYGDRQTNNKVNDSAKHSGKTADHRAVAHLNRHRRTLDVQESSQRAAAECSKYSSNS